MENFLLLGYVAIFVGVLKQIIIPTIIIGFLQYLICKKNFKLGFIMIVIGVLTTVICTFFTGSWLLLFNGNQQQNVYMIFTFISFIIPCSLPIVTPFIIQILAYKKSVKSKRENINKMKLADL